jgi:hypothetical protein
VSVYEQAFVYHQDVTAMSMSSTKYGITTKDLIGQLPLYLLILQYYANYPNT